MLPVDDMDKNGILTRLLRGDICTTTLYGLEPMQVNISVDLTAKALKITTPDGQSIPYNFRLEPQKQQPPHNIHPGKWEQRSSKKNKKRKGRGI
ncbi:hypothetical protein [Chitinophaga polysaccharea]|uniref:hypothetical protein n=1 Tax=Chitinophaga polysaccharea TaxID=1293035 RepID=UPI00115BC2F1|nr:hypothetical protein [Chitinophaga polysaccharea]